MLILICGSRSWPYPTLVFDEIRRLRQRHGANLVVLHGDAPAGADHDAHQACSILGIAERRLPALWREQGRSAGPIRNRKMLDQIEAAGGEVVAFRSDGESRGTDDLVRAALRRELPVRVVNESLGVSLSLSRAER